MKLARALTFLLALLWTAPVAWAQDEGPIEEGPVEEGPVDEGPVEEGPVDEGPVDEGPVDEGPVDEGPVDEGPVEEGPAPSDPKGPGNGQQKGEEELTPPKLIPESEVAAEYPAKAREEGLEAVVELEIDISATGAVEKAEVLKPSEHPGYGFEQAAVDALLKYRFEPAKLGDKPIPVRVTYRYGFTLETAEPDPSENPTDPDTGEQPAKPAVVNYTGRVLERGTRDPMPGVVVIVFRGEGDDAYGFEAVTDDEGTFEFRDLEEGDWKVLIEAPGYFPFRTAEAISTTELTEVVYFVERGSYNPFDVLVEAPKPKKEVNRRTISIPEIEKIPGNFGDPIKVVQNLPSVARVGFGSGDIIVRGSSPEDTKVYVSGVEVPLIFHFGGLRSVVPAGMLQSIDFEPGNFSNYYGRAIGGVLDVDLKKLRPERIHGYVDVNLYDSGIFLEAPILDNLSVAVGARRSYIDSVLTAVVPENAPLNLIAAPRYYDYQLLVSWRPAPAHELRLFYFASDDILEILFENPKELDTALQSGNLSFSTGFQRGILTHTWTPNEDLQHITQVSAGNDFIDTSLGDQLFFDLNVLRTQFRNELRYKTGDSATLIVGQDISYSKTDIDIRLPKPPQEGDADFNRDGLNETLTLSLDGIDVYQPAAYMMVELKGADDKLLVIPGLRVDYTKRSRQWTADPRIVGRYQLHEKWALKGGVGLFHQEPPPQETADQFGNPNLLAEQAIHYSLGAEYNPLEYLTIDATLFFKDMNSLSSRTGEVDDNGDPINLNNLGEGRVYGLDLLIRHNFANNFFGWIAYTLSRAERLDFGESEYRLFDFDQTHILTVIGSYRLPRNWEIGLRWRLVSGNPNTPTIGGVFNADRDEYDPIVGAVNSARLSPFHQLDLRIDKRWVYDTWMLNAYIDIQNIYNRSNVEGEQFNYDYSQSRPQQGLPILPIIGIKSEF